MVRSTGRQTRCLLGRTRMISRALLIAGVLVVNLLSVAIASLVITASTSPLSFALADLSLLAAPGSPGIQNSNDGSQRLR
jgi:hypothetical protein